jgi:uncharacterized protein (TIGR00255 family)
MTGFGRGEAAIGDSRVVIELRGVNNRYADIRLRLPVELAGEEAETRRRIQRRVRRGRVEVVLRVEKTEEAASLQTINRPLLEGVMQAVRTLEREYALGGQPDVMSVLSIPGMFRSEGTESEWQSEHVEAFFQALDTALDAFDADRQREGEALRVEILSRIERLEQSATRARARAASVPQLLRDRLLQRLESLKGSVELDPARVAQEAAFLADRCDVTEEGVRLDGHLEHARTLLTRPDEDVVGKRLEFLLQEMHREANTMSSKSSDLELTRHALAMKVEIEKAREQVLNLE